MDRQIQQYRLQQSLWTSLVSEYARPNINIKINGKRFSGLLDTGSGITIISKHLWPKSWPIQKVSCQIAKISQAKVQKIYQNPYHGPGYLVFDARFDTCLVGNSLSSLKMNACVLMDCHAFPWPYDRIGNNM